MSAESVSDGGPATAQDAAPAGVAIRLSEVSKTFRIPVDRRHTLKERVLRPRRARAATSLDALRDISVEVARGEFLGVVGRNGSGKSTLLKCIAGIYGPTEGKVEVAGRVSPFLELGVGFNPELTARENVVLASSLLGVSPQRAKENFDEIIEFAELEDFVGLKHKNYSTGMAMRLAFATAIHVDADVLLIDEALAVGDAPFKEKCYQEFWRMKDEGQTIVFVTHAMSLVTKFCDRALLLDAGELIATGQPRDVVDEYQRRVSDAYVPDTTPRGPAPAPEAGAPKRNGAPTPPLEPLRVTKPEAGGAGQVSEVWIEDASGRRQFEFEQRDDSTLHVRVSFADETEEPALGVIVKSRSGEDVVVRNTIRRDLRSVGDPGAEAQYTVRFYVYTAEGYYTLSLAITEESAEGRRTGQPSGIPERDRRVQHTSPSPAATTYT